MEKINEKEKNIELFYDVFTESIDILYKVDKKRYLDMMIDTANNILSNKVLNNISDESKDELIKIYSKLSDIEFNVEDTRKAIQLLVLRYFKEEGIKNENTTPDSIGILIAYLINKMQSSKKISLLDPMVGTGNLVFSIVNHLDKDITLYLNDHNKDMTLITKMTSDLLDIYSEIFLNDIYNLSFKNIDIIVSDISLDAKKTYQAILKFNEMLKDEGLMFLVVSNDFFNHDNDLSFKKELTKTSSIVGILELPNTIFVSNPKSIVVIKKKLYDKKKCFLVKLPSFLDVSSFNKEIIKLEEYFKNNEL